MTFSKLRSRLGFEAAVDNHDGVIHQHAAMPMTKPPREMRLMVMPKKDMRIKVASTEKGMERPQSGKLSTPEDPQHHYGDGKALHQSGGHAADILHNILAAVAGDLNLQAQLLAVQIVYHLKHLVADVHRVGALVLATGDADGLFAVLAVVGRDFLVGQGDLGHIRNVDNVPWNLG